MTFTRRRFLQNLSLGSGSVLLSPLVNQLSLQAEGIESHFPQRFVFLVKSSGLTPSAITPVSLKTKTADRSKRYQESLQGHALPKTLKDLEPFKDKVGIVQGFSGKMCLGGHTAWFGAMGVHGSPSENFGGVPIRATVDARLSARFPSPFGHVGLALRGAAVGRGGKEGMEGTLYPGLSAVGPGRELPYQASPDQAYDQLFGSVMAPAASRKRYDLEADMLNFVSDDIKRLRSNVPSAEQEKLAHYIVAFEELQERRKKLASMKEIIQKGAPEKSDRFASELGIDRLESHFALATSSLITGLTNGVTIRMDNLEHVYTGLGLTEQNVHAIGHDTRSNGKSSVECRDLIRAYHIKLIAGLAAKLQSVPEGDGTMLDNTMIVYMSDAGESHHGTLEQWPFLIVGGCGGRLTIPGNYVQMPGYGQLGHQTIGNFYTSILNAYGDPIEHYGDVDFELKTQGLPQEGPVPELMAAAYPKEPSRLTP